jgi:hypothetical protein
MLTPSRLQWKRIEIAILIVRAICILVSLPAVGLGIAIEILPIYYGYTGFIPSEDGGITSPTILFVLVRRMLPILFTNLAPNNSAVQSIIGPKYRGNRTHLYTAQKSPRQLGNISYFYHCLRFMSWAYFISIALGLAGDG